MRQFSILFIGDLISALTSCKNDKVFQSFTPINHYQLLGNTNKWGTGFMDRDSNIVFPLLQDTFQIHFDIDEANHNALIFSIGNIDTVGVVSTKNEIVYFYPDNTKEKYKLFDFNALNGEVYKIKNCGPLKNSTLKIRNVEHHDNEIIQIVDVVEGQQVNPDLAPPPPPPHRFTAIKTFKVSSKYGITEMDLYVGWANQHIKIKLPMPLKKT